MRACYGAGRGERTSLQRCRWGIARAGVPGVGRQGGGRARGGRAPGAHAAGAGRQAHQDRHQAAHGQDGRICAGAPGRHGRSCSAPRARPLPWAPLCSVGRPMQRICCACRCSCRDADGAMPRSGCSNSWARLAPASAPARALPAALERACLPDACAYGAARQVRLDRRTLRLLRMEDAVTLASVAQALLADAAVRRIKVRAGDITCALPPLHPSPASADACSRGSAFGSARRRRHGRVGCWAARGYPQPCCSFSARAGGHLRGGQVWRSRPTCGTERAGGDTSCWAGGGPGEPA